MSKILTISFLFALVLLSSTCTASIVGCQSYILKYQTGIDTPIRISNTGDIMCLSHDGLNCASQVYNDKDCINYFNAGAVIPLVCGTAQYNDPTHWCSNGRKYFQRWHCSDEGTGIDTGVSINPTNNNIQCLAFDGKNCAWNDFNTCAN